MEDNDYLKLYQQLAVLLPKLRSGEADVIEYGEPGKPGQHLSYLRIRYMNTAGGKQFSLHELNSLGQQGSGFYTASPDDLMAQAIKMVRHYHRPMKFPFRGSDPTELSWFTFTEGEQRTMPIHAPLRLEPGWVEVRLTLK